MSHRGDCEIKSERFMELEGLRGIAAIMVVLHHYLYAFLPYLVIGTRVPQHMRYEDNIYGTPLDIAYAGTFAVAIFFVLSGFVLSIGYFRSHDMGIIKKLAERRYLRLILPALAATMFCFLLISLGAAHIIDKASTITASSWLSSTWEFDANIFHAVYSGIAGVVITGDSPYDNVLWTMRTELLGSFLVFGFLLFLVKSKNRWLGYLALGVITFNTWYLAFIIGMLLADCYAAGVVGKIKAKSITVSALVVGAILLGSYPHGRVSGTMYHVLNIPLGGLKIDYETLYLTLGATMIILAILLSKRLQTWFKTPRISVIGKYTYSLYLTHLAVIYTLSTAIFIYLHDKIGYTKAVLVAAALSAPVIWGICYLFAKYIDKPSIRFAKNFMTIYAKQDIVQVVKRQVAYMATEIKLSVTVKAQVLSRTLGMMRRREDEE